MTKTWRRVAWFTLGAMGTALFLVVLYALLNGAFTTQAIRDSQKNNQQLLATIAALQKSNHQLLDTVNDCVKPTGKCFKRGQKQAALFGTSRDRHEIATAACQIGISRQSTPDTPQELSRRITACVAETLAQLDQKATH